MPALPHVPPPLALMDRTFDALPRAEQHALALRNLESDPIGTLYRAGVAAKHAAQLTRTAHWERMTSYRLTPGSTVTLGFVLAQKERYEDAGYEVVIRTDRETPDDLTLWARARQVKPLTYEDVLGDVSTACDDAEAA